MKTLHLYLCTAILALAIVAHAVLPILLHHKALTYRINSP